MLERACERGGNLLWQVWDPADGRWEREHERQQRLKAEAAKQAAMEAEAQAQALKQRLAALAAMQEEPAQPAHPDEQADGDALSTSPLGLQIHDVKASVHHRSPGGTSYRMKVLLIELSKSFHGLTVTSSSLKLRRC